jgi:hypothetical protein
MKREVQHLCKCHNEITTQNVMSARQHTHLGSNVGIHATFEKADISREFILANSSTPPDFDSGPTASTRQRINSLQKPCRKLTEHSLN